MKPVATQAILGPKALDLGQYLLLLRKETIKLLIRISQRGQELGDQRADRAALLCGSDLCLLVDLVGNGYGDISHECRISQFHRADAMKLVSTGDDVLASESVALRLRSTA